MIHCKSLQKKIADCLLHFREGFFYATKVKVCKKIGDFFELSSFIISGCDEKPWVVSGMEDGMSS